MKRDETRQVWESSRTSRKESKDYSSNYHNQRGTQCKILLHNLMIESEYPPPVQYDFGVRWGGM
jgi:hypothetical protein